MQFKYLFFISTLACLISLQSCTAPAEEAIEQKATSVESTMSPAAFKAVEMPASLANGDQFPTDSTVIDTWLQEATVIDGLETNPKVIGHAWGLWQAVTEKTEQTYKGRNLLRYETWYTPQDVMKAMALEVPLEKLDRTDGHLQARKKFNFGHHDKELNTSAGDIAGKVKYSPGLAQQILEGNYFSESVLRSKIKDSKTISRLVFDAQDVMLKPIYRVLTDSNRVAGTKDTYYFHLWSGKEDAGKELSDFKKKVKVSTNPNDPAIDNKTTFSIDAFIHHTMTAAEAQTYNASDKEGMEFNGNVKAGDPVILLGMHVSTRETQRWTWQSFYWSPTPDTPVFPSSAVIASGRKKLKRPLSAPAQHYAVSIGYSMMSPALPVYVNEPIDIQQAGVSPVYALNPYIEGTFTEAGVFPNQSCILKAYSDESGKMHDYSKQFYAKNTDGITSNCMSCHSQAAYPARPFTSAGANFFADQYINRNAPWFKGSVQLDFLWSLYPGFEQPLKLKED